MTALLALTTVLAWGFWIPVAQAAPGVPQATRTLLATVGNLGFAAAVLLLGGGHVDLTWRGFWFPLAGGVAWTAGSYSAFRAAELVGLARASGSWTPLNIVVAFIWGGLLFGELNRFGPAQLAALGAGLLLVLAGIGLIVRSRDDPEDGPASGEGFQGGRPAPLPPDAVGTGARYRRGLLLAGAAGLLWGSYFIPAQWAGEPAATTNFPLAVGILASGVALAAVAGGPRSLSFRVTAAQLAAGVLFGVGNLALLGLVSRVGTGVGFTIAQLSLLINVSVGIFVFKVPRPGSHAAWMILAGVLLAGAGGVMVGVLP